MSVFKPVGEPLSDGSCDQDGQYFKVHCPERRRKEEALLENPKGLRLEDSNVKNAAVIPDFCPVPTGVPTSTPHETRLN